MNSRSLIAFATSVLVAASASAAPQIEKFGVTVNSGATVYPGNVLFVDCSDLHNPDAHARAYLINQAGVEIQHWQTGSIRWLAKPVGTDGTVATFRGGGTQPTACSSPTTPLHLVKISPPSTLTDIYHDPKCDLNHDFEVLPDGTYLILCQTLITDPAVSNFPFYDNIIRRVDGSGSVLWSWSTDAHYSQLGLTAAARQIILAGQSYYVPTGADAATAPAHADVFHTNNIQYIPANATAATNSAFTPGNIMVDQRNTNLIFIIDYNSGNIVWQVGNISVGQHTARVIHSGLPGDGHILMLNNGGLGGYPPIESLGSSVVEYDPIAAKVVWNYQSLYPSGAGFTTFYRGSTQRLPNGDTFIDEAAWGRFFEVDTSGNIVWEYVHKFGVPTLNAQAPDRVIYRAYKVEACWPGCPADSTSGDGSWNW